MDSGMVMGWETISLEAKMSRKLEAMREDILYKIFLYLYKAYNALDREICLGILEGYGVGSQARCLLHTYWYHRTIVDHAGGYYRTPFKGHRG